jgi:RNA polymerase sigma-70 factor, ECF subfamily
LLTAPPIAAVLVAVPNVDVSERHFELIERAQRGDVRARDDLLRELYPIVAKHLSFLFGSRHVREEAIQESMIEIFRSLPKFKTRISVRGWALCIASRTSHRYLKKERPHSSSLSATGALPELGSSPALWDAKDELMLLQRYLKEIDPKKREAFVLVEILELTGHEAAEVLGVPENTVFSRVRHAKKEIEDRFARDDAELRREGSAS